MVMMKVFRGKDGSLLNIGDWDYQITREPVLVDSPVHYIDEETGEPFILMEKQQSYNQNDDGTVTPMVRQVSGNPLPDGAYEDQAEIEVGPDGGLYEVGK